MPLRKCAACKEQFEVPPVERMIESHIGTAVSSITFPNQVVQCTHCWQHYAILMQLAPGGMVQIAMLPVKSPTGVDTPPKPALIHAEVQA